MPDKEIVFQVREAPEGGYTARAVGYGIFTQGDDWEDLKYMLRDAVLCYFDDGEAPHAIRVHLVQNRRSYPCENAPKSDPAWIVLLSCCGVRYGYIRIARQRGSHMRLTSNFHGLRTSCRSPSDTIR